MKKTACIVFGGVSSEHEVSLRSATAVIGAVPRDRYDVVMLGITKEGQWLLYTGPADAIESGAWQTSADTCPAAISCDRAQKGILKLAGPDAGLIPVDVVFPVLHGKNGEDGTIQGMFEIAGIPYVGCGVLSSAVCMDKAVSHTLLVAAGVPKTKLIALTRDDTTDMPALQHKLAQELGYPMFVKPANAGSSVGVTKVKDESGLGAALDLAFEHDEKVVVEQQIIGQEVECAVMGNRHPVASKAIAEIVPPDGYYDYAAKYLNDSAGLHIPANVAAEVSEKVRACAVKAYKALGCRGFARVDFFAKADGSVVLNEINTIPGFTSISMFPKMFEHDGVPFPELVDRLLQYALEV